MRYSWFSLLMLLPGLLLTGCKKDKPIVAFDVVDTWSAVVDVTGPPSTAYLGSSWVYSTGAVACEQNKTSLDQLQSATLTGVEISISGLPDHNFDFLRRITLYLLDEQGQQILFASQDNIPHGATQIKLTPTGASMLPYLRSGK